MALPAVVTCLLVCAVAVFVMWPAPELSEDVLEWQKSGNTFTYQNYNIFFHDVKGSGPASEVLVIFHGYPTCSYDFIEVWDGLLERYGRVIAPDFLGFGLSDKPPGYEYSVMDMADMIGSLLVDLKVDAFHILAHDLGDTVAQEIVARYNEGKFVPNLSIKSVCLLNGGILPEHHQPRLSQKLLLNPYVAPVLMRLMNLPVFSRALGECFGEETRPTDKEYEDHWALVRYNDGHLVHHGLIQYIPERFANRDRWVRALSETKLPLHLIYGAADPVNPPATFLADYKKLIPNSGFTELPAHIGHYSHLEDPEGVLKGYLKFLNSLKGGKGADSQGKGEGEKGSGTTENKEGMEKVTESGERENEIGEAEELEIADEKDEMEEATEPGAVEEEDEEAADSETAEDEEVEDDEEDLGDEGDGEESDSDQAEGDDTQKESEGGENVGEEVEPPLEEKEGGEEGKEKIGEKPVEESVEGRPKKLEPKETIEEVNSEEGKVEVEDEQ